MRKIAGMLAALSVGALALVRCVGDSSNPTDGGNDVTTADGGNDVTTTTDGGAEAEAAPPPPPTPDGGIVWFQHYNTNAQLVDVSASDPQGNVILVGGLRTCSGCSGTSPDYQTHIGGFSLPSTPPSYRTDALVAKLNSSGSAVWARSPNSVPNDAGLFGGNDDFMNSVAVDSNGDIYIAGTTSKASITLKDTLAGPCTFVAKLSSDGTTYLWDHAYTSTGYVNQAFIAVNGTKLAVAMSYSGTLSYDSGQSVAALGNSDAFAVELNTPDGSTVWHQTWGGSQYDNVYSVAITPTNDMFVSGSFGSTMAGNGTGFPLNLVGTQPNGYLAKLAAADGKAIYTLGYGDSASAGEVDITTVAYSNGIVALGGLTYGTNVDFGKGSVGSTQGDGFVLAYDEVKKQALFTSMLASDQYDTILGVDFDPWGYLVATGSYAGYGSTTAKLGTQTLPNSTYRTQPMLVAKWNPTGTLLWVDTYIPSLVNGNPPYTTPDAGDGYLWLSGARVHTASNGTVYVAGGMSGSAIMGSQGYQTKLSTLGPENLVFCYPGPCAAYESPDGLVGAWRP